MSKVYKKYQDKQYLNNNPILKKLLNCSTATRETFLDNRILSTTGTRKCYQSDSNVIQQMLGVVSVPIYYLFDIQVEPKAENNSQKINVQSFLSLELQLVPSVDEKNNWVSVPNEYNVVDFVFRYLLQTFDNKPPKDTFKNSYDKLITHTKIYVGSYTDKEKSLYTKLKRTPYKSELINDSELKTGIAEGKNGMKVSFITFHYENIKYITQLFIHIFPIGSLVINTTPTEPNKTSKIIRPTTAKSQTPDATTSIRPVTPSWKR